MASSSIYKILVIDDEPEFYDNLFRLSKRLVRLDFEPSDKIQNDVKDNLSKQSLSFDCLILDLHLGKNITFDEGIDFLGEVRSMVTANVPIIVSSFDERKRTAVRAIDNGAADFLYKSQYARTEWEFKIIETIEQPKEALKKELSNKSISSPVDFLPNHLPFLSKKFNSSIRKIISAYQYYNAPPCLIFGEPGVGKKYWARQIYRQINQTSVSPIELDLALFHDDNMPDKGEIESCHIISSIDSLFYKDGPSKTRLKELLLGIISGKNKVVFISNTNISEIEKTDEVGQEILDRFAPFTIEILPLRARKEDLKAMINDMLSHSSVCPAYYSFFGKTIEDVFDEEAIAALQKYDWNGNVKELRGAIRYAINGLEIPINKEGMPINAEKIPIDKKIQRKDLPKPIREVFMTEKEEAEDTEKRIARRRLGDIQKEFISKNDFGNAVIKEEVRGLFLLHPDLFDQEIEVICKVFNLEVGFSRAINIMFWCARGSQDILNEFLVLINPYIVNRPIIISQNTKFEPGAHDAILELKMKSSDISIFLLCDEFLTSDDYQKHILDFLTKYLYDKTEESWAKKIHPVPVVTKTCLWKETPIKGLKVLPVDGIPVTKKMPVSEALEEVFEEIKKIIETFKSIPSHP